MSDKDIAPQTVVASRASVLESPPHRRPFVAPQVVERASLSEITLQIISPVSRLDAESRDLSG